MTNIIKINSITDLHNFLGCGKPKHPLITLIDFSKIKHQLEIDDVKVVTNFYSINFKEKCSDKIKYGQGYYDFQEGSLMFMAPEQMMSVIGDIETNDTKGWGISFHPDLIRRSSLGSKIKEYTFFSYDSNEALHLSEVEKETITEIVMKIEQEFSSNIDNYSHDLINTNLELLLNYCKRYYGRQFITRTNQNKDVVSRFEKFIENHFKSEELSEKGIPTVKYFAEQMNFSTNYLSDLLKKETGKNTQDHIHHYLIEEAKTLLLNSNNTISEIAYKLGFEYPQYFSRLFSKKVGISPTDYRA